MKKLIILLLGILLIAGVAYASNISNSKHNLRSLGSNSVKGDIDQICVYCHTPHGARQSVAPLWNRNDPDTTSFTPYTSTTMNTTPGQPTGVSKACLSCHDGATSINVLVNYNGAAYNGGANTPIPSNLIADLGADLSNDHPIGISLATAASGDSDIRNAPTNATLTPLYNGNVECSSCHNVHDNTNFPFLRGSNAGSVICLSCHNK